MTLPYTAGVQRILTQARQLAGGSHDGEITPTHLLWAVAADETEATKLLADAGINRDSLPESLTLDASENPPTACSEPVDSQETGRVLDRARAIMRRSMDSEVSSLHLLSALIQVESNASRALLAAGLNESSVSLTNEEGEPLAVELDLGLMTTEEPPVVASPQPGQSPTTSIDRLPVWRIIDAAWNRLREGLRVVEDSVRFVLDDAPLTRELKQVRHNLTAAVAASFDRSHLLSSRDTEHDVGTSISTDREHTRASLDDVVQANMSRVQESLRTLEEFSKLVSSDGSQAFEAARYQTYTIEKHLWDKWRKPPACDPATMLEGSTQAGSLRHKKLTLAKLYLLVTSDSCNHPIEQVVREAVAGGVQIVQLREKHMDDRGLVELGRRIRSLTAELGALFVMNDRPDLAVLTDADGVHVGQEELSVADARQIVGPSCLIGVSTHSIQQAYQAVQDGADYIGVGPTFPSGTKSFTDFAGLDYVGEVQREIDLPAFAIGGIDLSNIAQVQDAGAKRVSVSGAICRADSPATAAQELSEALARHRSPAGCPPLESRS